MTGLKLTLWSFAKYKGTLTFASALSVVADLSMYGKQWKNGQKPQSCSVEYKDKIDGRWIQTATGTLTKSVERRPAESQGVVFS